ncbi:copper chaperone PCu(A)C [Streptomyces sp. DSM 44917]|uniref:Copper chaperone PCu(A)C n=1 Tax=Streptomyces boetiae TaxID=3075541 RepID=A0ABU2LE36_9ACTN|nr:copper chaperone PCu(A)C [Streptomyces sp. DSM 44917]MDT0309859.1 copper chaperone PCu(A)C [Streptomyces sp. DSM 44917]
MSRRTAPVLAALLALAATACGGDGGDGADAPPELSAADAYIPEPPTAELAGGFLTLRNTGGADDALTGASSDLAAAVEIHETVDNAMREAESLTIPAGGELRLGRGGSHLMLIDLSHRPEEGETVTVELRFATSEPITLDVPVASATHTGE